MNVTMSGLGDRVNLNSPATEPGPLTDSDFKPRTITPTRRSIWHRTKRLARIAWLRFDIHCLESYIADCERDGILQSQSMTEFRLELGRQRVQLLIAEAS